MRKVSHRRRWVRAASFLTALILVLGVFAIRNYSQAESYRLQVEHNYQRSLNELNDYVSNIQTSLNKGIYANTPPMISILANNLWREAAGAKSSMGQLPLSDLQLENTYRFLSQVGEYAQSLSKKTAKGETLTVQEHEQIVKLSELAKGLSEHISAVRGQLDDGTLQINSAQNALRAGSGEMSVGSFSDGMSSAEESMVDYPTMIYDGPFSDHIMNRPPKRTENEKEVDREQARTVAAGFLGIDAAQLTDAGDEEGVMPSYGFASGDISISITKKGGLLCYFMNPRYAGESVMTQEEAVGAARSYLEKNGIRNMKESYYMTGDGVCVVNFAYVQDDVILYPDLIKVGVALDNGEIVAFDARGYLVNHSRRDLPAPKYSFENAKAVISPYLKIIDYRQALIPTPGGSEELCYEFHCKSSGGEEVLVYISTQTCTESQILLLLYSDGGVLTK